MVSIDSFVRKICVKEAIEFNLEYDSNEIIFPMGNAFFEELYHESMQAMKKNSGKRLLYIGDWKVNYAEKTLSKN